MFLGTGVSGVSGGSTVKVLGPLMETGVVILEALFFPVWGRVSDLKANFFPVRV